MLLLVAALPVAAQTPEQIEAEPLVKLQPGETPVPGECLMQEELDLIEGLNALRRPTVGVEGDGDDARVVDVPLDAHNNATFEVAKDAVLAVAALTPQTTQPARFTLTATGR